MGIDSLIFRGGVGWVGVCFMIMRCLGMWRLNILKRLVGMGRMCGFVYGCEWMAADGAGVLDSGGPVRGLGALAFASFYARLWKWIPWTMGSILKW